MVSLSSTGPTEMSIHEAGILPPCRRAALLRNKTVILDTLAAADIARIEISFEDLPFGCFVDLALAYDHAGLRPLPQRQVRYAAPGRRKRFRHQNISLISAFSNVIDDLLADASNAAIGAEGTLHIDVASRTFLLTGRSHAFDQRSFRRLY